MLKAFKADSEQELTVEVRWWEVLGSMLATSSSCID